MRILKLTTLLAVPAALIATPALAGETEMSTAQTPQEVFTSVDLDESGDLSRDEFVSYAVTLADTGDSDYKGIVLSGGYDDAFTAKDADASGTISLAELGLEDGSKDEAE